MTLLTLAMSVVPSAEEARGTTVPWYVAEIINHSCARQSVPLPGRTATIRAPMSERRPSLLRSAGSIGAATAVSRVLGLVREQVQAYAFGAGFATDAFLAAFRIPNLLRDLFAEGALSAALVPTLTATRQRDGEAALFRLVGRIVGVVSIFLGGVAVLTFAFARPILHLYTPGFTGDKLALAATMVRILSPFLLFVALASVAMGVLNTLRVFFLPALAPAWFNVSCIAGMLLLPPLLAPAGLPTILALAIGAIVGGAAQVAAQWPALRRRGFRPRWDWAPRDPGVVKIAGLMFPAVFGLAATQINILVDTMLASNFGDGPISWLSYAFRLIQLPIGLFGVSIATANLVRVSADGAAGDLPALRGNLASAIRAAALLTLPATAGLIALRGPIVRILYQHGGRFGDADTRRTAAALLCYAAGLFAYAVTKVLVPTFYALGDTRVPVAASAAAVGTKVAASFVLISVFRTHGVSPFLALAAATSLAAWVNFGLLAWGIRRRAGSLRGHGVFPSVAGMALVSAVMGAACASGYAALARLLPSGTLTAQATRLAAIVASGTILTAAGGLLVRVPEARELLLRLRARVAHRDRRA
jgi:putative peptidoglycan lipid II flippase